MSMLYPVLFAVALLGAGFVLLFRKLASRPVANAPDSEWLTNFSLDIYAPMERLLDERDFVFLSQQPGYDPHIAKRLRAERKQVFNAYLGRLEQDFNRLAGICKFMLVHSAEDRLDFAKTLWRQQMTFYFSVYVLRFRLALYPVVLGTWDIQGLVGKLGHLQQELQRAAAPREWAGSQLS